MVQPGLQDYHNNYIATTLEACKSCKSAPSIVCTHVLYHTIAIWQSSKFNNYFKGHQYSAWELDKCNKLRHKDTAAKTVLRSSHHLLKVLCTEGLPFIRFQFLFT